MNEEKEITKEVKEERKPKKKSVVLRIINIALWVLLLAWMALVILDFINIKNNKDPKYCWFNNKTTEYSDGSVTECSGIGYKVIKYNRASYNAIEFGPFWIKDRTKDNK